MRLYSYRYWRLNQLIWEKYQLNSWERWTIQLSHQSRLKIMSIHLRKISESHWIEKNQSIDQSNNSFVYMKRFEDSKDSCKINLHEKEQENHMTYRKCLQFNNRIRFYSNVLRIFFRILVKLVLIESMLNHDRRCISIWIDDLTLVC